MLRIEDCTARRRTTSAGFTAIEMIVVVSIVIMLVAMTVPSIFPAIKKGRVHDAANAIMRASSQARQLARSHQQPSGSGTPSCYGVAIVVPASGPAYATVIFGTLDPNTSAVLTKTTDTSGGAGGELCGDISTPARAKPIARYEFNRNVLPYRGVSGSPGTPTYTMMSPGTSVGWFYQYRTGFVIQSPTDITTTRDVGPLPSIPGASGASLSPAPVSGLGQLGVCTVDSKYVAAVAIYKIGLGNLQDL